MHGKKFDKSDIILNAVDLEKFRYNAIVRHEYRSKCGFSDNDNVLGFVGRFGEEKNPLFLLEILKNLRAISSSYKLLMIGNGDLFHEFEKRVESYQLSDSVCLVGTQKDTSPWYQAMDAFLLPSLFEGFPVVSLEAQAARLPCFFSNNITREIDLGSNNSFLSIADGTADEWANAISTQLNKRIDRGVEIKELSKYDIKYAASELLAKYQKLIW